MKIPALRFVALLTAALSLGACAPQPRHVPFDETAFAGYAGSGSGTITGTAFIVMQNHNYTKTANHNATVKLLPVNAYTDEIVTRHYFNREKLEPADPRLARYVRRTHPDDDGNFTLHGVPAGHYYVSCHFYWSYDAPTTDGDGNAVANRVDEDQWIYARVSIGSGQTVRVESWTQGG